MTLLLLACTATKPDPVVTDTSTPTTDSAPTDTDPTDSTPTDLDGDDDGYLPPDDCDDADASVHPGATDVPGNTVDEDCDGLALSDADGDGHAPTEEGGDDCDDADPWTYTGAVEYCDPVDQDCDGVPIAPGGCEGWQEPKAWAKWVFTGVGNHEILRDQDGDGLMELVTGSGSSVLDVDGVDVGPAWGLFRGLPPVLPEDGSAGAAQVLTAHGRTYGIDAGDVTGDGIPDLAFFGPFLYEGWVLPGPLPMDGTLIDGMESDLVWIGTYRDPDEWCVEATMGGDFDADGVNDVLCNTQDLDEEGTLEFFRGGQFGQAALEADFGNGEENLFFSLLPDLDGDGANELALEWRGDASIVDGASIASGGDVMDSLVAWVTYPTYNLTGVDDRTGDGLPDFVAADGDADFLGYSHGAVYMYEGTRTGELTPESSLGCFVGSDAGLRIWGGRSMRIRGGEVDATELQLDGYDDLRETNVVVVTPVPVPTWGEPLLQWGLAFENSSFRASVNVENIGNVDVLGSGDDMLLYDPHENADAIYNSYLYLGWDVPWFDRTYWPNAE